MEVEHKTSIVTCRDNDDDISLPGFRFHPTDEELVGFYLRRKVEKSFSIELIKQIDIYKYDPWDLPRGSNVGDKEWYFFCKRGRKYRNSIRPNRVTGSGFWKATGIDRPIYSARGEGQECIGLKKSLVYYRGCAGKGTKTDWMMHEFRLPPDDNTTKYINNDKPIAQEAEVWTLCRILKRNVSYKKCTPDWREVAAAKRSHPVDSSSKTSSLDSDKSQGYISFRDAVIQHHENYETHQLLIGQLSTISPTSSTAFYTDLLTPDVNEILKNGDWDELRSGVELATDPYIL